MRGCLIAVCLWLAVGGVEAQDDAYDRAIDDAVAAFERGEWSQAHALFERAQAVYPNARALRGLGMTDFNLHLYARATAELEDALRSPVQPLDADLRTHVEGLLQRSHPYVARLTLQLSPTDAQLTIDDAPPLFDAQRRVLLDLGVHTLRLQAAGYTPYVRSLTAVPGESSLALTALPIERAPVVAPARKRPLLRWLAFAGGVAALGAGTGTWIGSNHRFDTLERECRASAGCLDPELGPTRRLERASYALFGIGAALNVAAFVWWLLDTGSA